MGGGGGVGVQTSWEGEKKKEKKTGNYLQLLNQSAISFVYNLG